MKVGDIELFLHLFGVVSVFVGFGTLLLATIALVRTSRVEQVRVRGRGHKALVLATTEYSGRCIPLGWIGRQP